jgi:PAS domain S-box-containing protein
MQKPIIDARQAIEDIRAGMDDAALMRKYRISARGLQSMYNKLLESGILAAGEIEDRMEIPEGSVIIEYAEIPLAGREARGPVSAPKPAASALAISDDAQFLGYIKTLLETQGISVTLCENALPDEQLVRQVAPSVVLADLDEGGEGYLDVVRSIRRMDRSIPVIAIATPANRSISARAIEEGAFCLVEKPCDPIILLATIRRGLEHAELIRFKWDQGRITEEKITEETLELARSTHFLKGILESSSLVSIVVTDPDQNVLFWNKGAESIFGYSGEEMLGKRISRLYPPDALTKDTVDQLRETLGQDAGTRVGKLKQVTKDGRMVTVSLAVSPLTDAKGSVQGIVGIGLDVTEEVRQNKEIMKLLHHVRQTHDVSVFTLARLTEFRDAGIEGHLIRIQEFCRTLCNRLASRRLYGKTVIPKYTDDIVRSSVLHDIGKVGLPDSVVLCASDYTFEQREHMKQHTLIGGKALQDAVKKLGIESFLTLGMEIAYYHHERWDGSGYPFGLRGDEIPLSARIVAVADVYDALTSPRPYRKAMSHDDACGVVVEGASEFFDPELVLAFEQIAEDWRKIKAKYS